MTIQAPVKIMPYKHISSADLCSKPLPALPKEMNVFPKVVGRYAVLRRMHQALAENPNRLKENKAAAFGEFGLLLDIGGLLSDSIYISQFLATPLTGKEIDGVFRIVDNARREVPGDATREQGNLAYILEFQDNEFARRAFANAFLSCNGDFATHIRTLEWAFNRIGVKLTAPFSYGNTSDPGARDKSGLLVGSFHELGSYLVDHQN